MAKRSKQTKQQKRLQRRRKGNQVKKFSPEFLKRIKNRGTQLQFNPVGEIKMSEVILSFAEPLMVLAKGEDDQDLTDVVFEQVIVLAITAWNASMMENGEAKKMLEDCLQTFQNIEDQTAFGEVLSAMVSLKKELFGEIDRYIIDYEIIDHSHQRQLNIVSSLEK